MAVVGATGLVGGTLCAILAERGHPAAALRALTVGDPAGRSVGHAGARLPLESCSDAALASCAVVVLAVPAAVARELAPRAVAAGAIAVDLSEAHRLDPAVPLVVTGLNDGDLADHRGIVASPNCTNVGAALVLHALREAAGLRGATVTTLQAASGAGRRGLAALEDPGAADAPFPRPLRGDVLPQCGAFVAEGHTEEEERFVLETRRLLRMPALTLAVTCVRVPVAVGHAAAMTIETERPLTPAQARAALSAIPAIAVDEDGGRPDYRTPAEAAGGDRVHVGRVRAGRHPRELQLWQVTDNLRRGAALNAADLVEALLRQPGPPRGR